MHLIPLCNFPENVCKTCIVIASQRKIFGFLPISPVATVFPSDETAIAVTSSVCLSKWRYVCVCWS